MYVTAYFGGGYSIFWLLPTGGGSALRWAGDRKCKIGSICMGGLMRMLSVSMGYGASRD